jgi:hypothetical protein
MSFSVTTLLLHSADVPLTARRALRAAHDATAEEERAPAPEAAARILNRDLRLGLDCRNARELVGLSSDGGCA